MSVETPALSIIIPVHNGEITLARCLDSIVKQPASKSVEIICVNDHSTDRSSQVIDKYPVMKLESAGRGVSAARNTGLAAAHGDYLWFVDADDYLRPNVIDDSFIRKLVQQPADCLVVGVEKRLANGRSQRTGSQHSAHYDLKIDSEVRNVFKQNILNSSWNKLYLRKILVRYNLVYPTFSIGEDAIFNYDFFTHAQTLMVVPTVMYVFNIFSTSSSKFYWKVDQLAAARILVNKLLMVHQHTKLVDDELLFQTLIDTLLGSEANLLNQQNGNLSRKQYYHELRQKNFNFLLEQCKKAQCSTNRGYRLKYWIAKSRWRSYWYIHHHLMGKSKED